MICTGIGSSAPWLFQQDYVKPHIDTELFSNWNEASMEKLCFHYTQQILKEWRRSRLSMIQIQNEYIYNFEVTFLLFIYFEI